MCYRSGPSMSVKIASQRRSLIEKGHRVAHPPTDRSAQSARREASVEAARSRRDGREAAVDLEVPVDLPRRRVAALDQLAPRRAEPRAKNRIEDEARGLALELVLVPEEEAGDALLDQGAVALDVGGEHGATERERLED